MVSPNCHKILGPLVLSLTCLLSGCTKDPAVDIICIERTDPNHARVLPPYVPVLSNDLRQRFCEIYKDFAAMQIDGTASLYGTSHVAFESLSLDAQQRSYLNGLVANVQSLLDQVHKPVVIWTTYFHDSAWVYNPFIETKEPLQKSLDEIEIVGRQNLSNLLIIRSILASCYLFLESEQKYDTIYSMMLQSATIADSIHVNNGISLLKQQDLIWDIVLMYSRIRPSLTMEQQQEMDIFMETQGRIAQRSLIRYLYYSEYEIECFIPVLITRDNQDGLKMVSESLTFLSQCLNEESEYYLSVTEEKASKWENWSDYVDEKNGIPMTMNVVCGVLKYNSRIQEKIAESLKDQ